MEEEPTPPTLEIPADLDPGLLKHRKSETNTNLTATSKSVHLLSPTFLSRKSVTSDFHVANSMAAPSTISMSWNSSMMAGGQLTGMVRSASASVGRPSLSVSVAGMSPVHRTSVSSVLPSMVNVAKDKNAVEPVMVADGRIMMEQKIGAGAFGDIHLGLVIATNENVAIKRELRSSKYPQLPHENKVYSILRGNPCIPNVYWFGSEGTFNLMAMQMLGPSLEDQFNFCLRKFHLKTVLQLGIQMLTAIEVVHNHDILHRDIKPDNFLIGLSSSNQNHSVFIIDFGLSKRYRDPKTQQHIPFRNDRSLTGTARYASLNTHLGCEQSRRDDLEAIGFVLLYFLRGSLPWQGLKSNNPKVDIGKVKQSTTFESLCEHFPHQFVTYLSYCRNLKFEEKPDYNYLKGLFNEIYTSKGYDTEPVSFDWESLNYKEKTFTHMPIPVEADNSLIEPERIQKRISSVPSDSMPVSPSKAGTPRHVERMTSAPVFINVIGVNGIPSGTARSTGRKSLSLSKETAPGSPTSKHEGDKKINSVEISVDPNIPDIDKYDV